MRTALLITAKDLRQRLRDRSALLVGIVAPLALALALSVTISGFAVGSSTYKIGVVNLDHGAAAASFFKAAKQAPVRLKTQSSDSVARKRVEDGKLDAAIVLPAGLSAAFLGGAPVKIEVLGDPGNQVGALVARALSDSYASYAHTIQLASLALGNASSSSQVAATKGSSLQPPVSVSDTSTTHRNLNPKTYYAAAMAVFFLFFAVQFGVSSLLDERRDGTLARMLAAPISRRSIVGAKALTSISIGLTSMVVLALTTRYALGAHWGDPFGIGVLILSAVLAATGVTALVTTLAKTEEQANAWLSMVSLILGMLGGSFFPVAQAGGVLAVLSKMTPHAWFLSGLQDLSSGEALSSIVKPSIVLLAIAAASGGLALTRVRKLIEP